MTESHSGEILCSNTVNNLDWLQTRENYFNLIRRERLKTHIAKERCFICICICIVLFVLFLFVFLFVLFVFVLL